jgi:site-specific recombinase XerC
VLRILYAWLEEEAEIDHHPTVRMKPPIVPDRPVLVIPDDALWRPLQSCAGKDFDSRRDTAIIMLLLDTGVRRAELASIRLDHLDLDYQLVRVLAKGRVERLLPFGRRPPRRWTATCASAPATRTRRCRGCGLASRAG